MKILFCTNAFENITNGPVRFANIILDINTLLPEHEIRILTEDVSEQRLQYLKNVYKVKLSIPRFLKPLGQILRWFIYYRHVREIRKTYTFDVLVFINSFNGTWASLVSTTPTAGMINDEKNMLATWKNVEFKPLWIKRFTFQQFEKLSARRHRLIIANSEFMTQRLITGYGLPETKVRRLYKCIPLEGLPFDPQRPFETIVNVLFVKADYLVGNLPMLAESLRLLQDYQFRLTVIGPEPAFEHHLRTLFVGISNVVLEYVGPQPQQRVFEYMRTYDIFCVPSYTEAFGVANIEALAHGISVISTRVGGIPEVLDHGNNGWLVESGNTKDLAAAVKECIEHPEMRLRKAQNGLKFIQKFSKDEMLRNFVEMLESVIDKG